MRTAFTSLVFFTLSALLAAPTAKADHHELSASAKRLIGTWSVKMDDGRKSELTYKMAPTGNALIGEWRYENGISTIVVLGNQGENEVTTGYMSDGAYWQITSKLPIGDQNESVMLGRNSDGNDWKGKFISEQISNDQRTWKIDGKDNNGETFKLSATMTRKK
jgi:hypothetical protein